MNRKHTRADYLAIIARLRQARGDLALSSDFIVGFPGETEADFRATLSLVEEVGFAGAYSFMYSARPGTPAAEMEDQVADEEKAERLQRLQALITRAATRLQRRLRRPHASTCCWKSRASCLGNWSANPHICRRCR